MRADKAADPVRYAPLSDPGDSYSYDIFSQAGQAVRDVHSRGAASAALSQSPQADVPAPSVVFFRRDLGVPVLAVETETDLLALGYLPDQQADSRGFRLWEVAGASHADDYLSTIGLTDDGSGTAAQAEFQHMLNPPTATPAFTCATPINTSETNYILDAAQYALNRWTARGIAPAHEPRPEVTTSATTTPFSAAKLAALYPTHRQFVIQWAVATVADVAAGLIRPADGQDLIAAAAQSSVGG